MLSQDSGHLLAHAVSKLNPEVFSHPVWVRFSYKEISISTRLIDELLNAAKVIQEDDPYNACQILFTCVACQNHVRQHDKALLTLRQIQSLAERNRIYEVVIWVKWGICSIHVQRGDYEQAVIHLEDLQTILNQQNEWMLVDFIDIVKESLRRPPANIKVLDKPNYIDPPGDLLTHTYHWLHHWGNSSQMSDKTQDSRHGRPGNGSKSTHQVPDQSLLSIQQQPDYWHKLLLMVRNTFKRQWGNNKNGHKKSQSSIPVNTPYAINISSPQLEPKVGNKQEKEKTVTVNNMVVQMLGSFHITIQDFPFKLPASRGLSLLKYLILHHNEDAPRDMLMDIFWPEAEPEAARNNLNVALHSLRHALRSVTDREVIHFEDSAYGLAPDLEIWLDVDEFEHCIKEGNRLEIRNQLNSAVTEYEIAINLYRGDFLSDNPYENWTVFDRERLRVAYLDTLDRLSRIYFNQNRYASCATLCQLILNRDRCREDAHCRLMHSYSRLGQGALALRQYQICVEALRSELEVDPAPETTHLFEQVRSHKRI